MRACVPFTVVRSTYDVDSAGSSSKELHFVTIFRLERFLEETKSIRATMQRGLGLCVHCGADCELAHAFLSLLRRCREANPKQEAPLP